MSNGFVRIKRKEALELLKTDLNAFLLLMLQALEARWNDETNHKNLKRGESCIGAEEVNKLFGWTIEQYRQVKKRNTLKYKIATYLGTPSGTRAKFVDNTFCMLFEEDHNIPNNIPNNIDETEATTQKQHSYNIATTPNKEQRTKEVKKETTTSADAHDADFSFDPMKAKAMLEEFWKTWEQTPSQQKNYLKKGIGHCFAALRHISDPSFTINKTAIAAFVWAFTSKPWLEKANQPKPMSNRERIEQNFIDGESYNKAICGINSTAISFHRGMKVGGTKFDDKTFMANFSKVLEEFGIENPFKIKLDSVKEA